MQLSDILEKNSVQAISDKTKILEENIEYVIASEFASLTKVKMLGFISIIEREYEADLSTVKEKAEEYYGDKRISEYLFPIGQPVIDEHRAKPTVLIIFIFILIGVISWYFVTQFDKKNLNELIHFLDEQTIENFIGNDEEESSTQDETVSLFPLNSVDKMKKV
ncbi:MAG: hypothetical protein Q9M39_06230 [Sulfurovum sp.]|nr:hypothetical protein [Sulfurovum sp.]